VLQFESATTASFPVGVARARHLSAHPVSVSAQVLAQSRMPTQLSAPPAPVPAPPSTEAPPPPAPPSGVELVVTAVQPVTSMHSATNVCAVMVMAFPQV
jgi:hypothetical protein